MEIIALTLALIIILGIIFNKFFVKVGVPTVLGLLILGMILGPYGFNVISSTFLDLSADVRIIALIIILLRAGLGLQRDTLRRVGKPALAMSVIPCIIEGIAILFISQQILGISFLEAGMLGFILAAPAPAILVPEMLSFIEQKKGIKRGIPTLLMAGSGINDVVAITIFSAFFSTYLRGDVNIILQILEIPLSLILGAAGGLIIGITVLKIFKHWKFNDSEKLLLILAFAIVFNGIGDLLQGIIPLAALVGVMLIGFILVDNNPNLGYRLSQKYSKVWLLAEILLFVMLGAQVDIQLSIQAGLVGILIISLGLIVRSLGVYISLMDTPINLKEKIFCMVSYMPKAIVPAAIGPLPLLAGIPSGDIILAISVLAILITTPIGGMAIKIVGDKFLEVDLLQEEI